MAIQRESSRTRRLPQNAAPVGTASSPLHSSRHVAAAFEPAKLNLLTSLVLGCFSIGVALASGNASAQAAATPTDPTTPATDSVAAAPTAGVQSLDAVQVTARRRNESLVDVPLAISVVTQDKIQKLGLQSTTDIANFVPSLEFNSFTPGNSRNDRGSGRNVAFRGLLLTTGGGNAASVFLDGAAVVGNEIPVSLDVGQVEVVRGPQSVYFGRSTMTGAIAYTTRAIPDQLTGEVVLEGAQRNEKSLTASIAGPIVPGLLGARFTVLDQSTDGYVTNSYNNTTLGDQSRKSYSTTVEFTPFDKLSFKGYYNRFKDDDGPSATAFVPASLDNCKLGTTQTTFCGEIPDRRYSINYINTTVPTSVVTAGVNGPRTTISNLIFSSPLIAGTGFEPKIGQQRVAENSDLVTNWDINSYLRFQAITAYHTNVTMAALDGFGQAVQPTFGNQAYFYTLTQKFRDFDQEIRLSSDPNRRISWTVGANYIHSDTFVDAIVAQQAQGTTRIGTAGAQSIGDQISRTLGVFAGAYIKVVPQLTLSLEAREQEDRREASAYAGTTNGGATAGYGALLSDLSQTYKSFSPRASLSYDLGNRQTLYTSYASGNRPGGFNTGIAGQANNPTALAQIGQLLAGGGSVAYREEKLKVVEVGYKGEVPDGRGFFDVNVYAGKLSNQQITVAALIPTLGYSVSGTTNAGEAKIHGVEFQGDYAFTRQFSVATTAAWNYTDRTSFLNTAGVPEFGTTDFSGKKFAFVPEYSASVVGTYTYALPSAWQGYSTVAVVYRGKEYADVFNASYIKGRVQTDLRTGATHGNYTVEAFVRNVFNNQDYTGGNVAPDYGTVSYNAFFGGWAPPRQVGVRLLAKF